MLPYNRTDAATAYPQTCIACRNGNGPFVDTHSELRVPGDAGGKAWMHVYVCQRCVEWSAQALDMFDELETLRGALSAAEEENVALTEILGRNDSMIAEAVERQRAKRELLAIPGGAS